MASALSATAWQRLVDVGVVDAEDGIEVVGVIAIDELLDDEYSAMCGNPRGLGDDDPRHRCEMIQTLSFVARALDRCHTRRAYTRRS